MKINELRKTKGGMAVMALVSLAAGAHLVISPQTVNLWIIRGVVFYWILEGVSYVLQIILNYTTRKVEQENNVVVHNGFMYWYEYKPARHDVDLCLATTNPKEYCNGYYLYSSKDPGNGMAYVITKTNNVNCVLRNPDDE